METYDYRLSRLTRFGVRNFKAIGEYQEIDIKPINLFFGANNAGKSSILEAFIYGLKLLNNHSFDDELDLDQIGKKITGGSVSGKKNYNTDNDSYTIFTFYIRIEPLFQEFCLQFSKNHFHFDAVEPDGLRTLFHLGHGLLDFDHKSSELLFINELFNKIIFWEDDSQIKSHDLDTDSDFEPLKSNITNLRYYHSDKNPYGLIPIIFLEFDPHGIVRNIREQIKFLITNIIEASIIKEEVDHVSITNLENGDIKNYTGSLMFKSRIPLWIGPDREVPTSRLIFSKKELTDSISTWGYLFRNERILKYINAILYRTDYLNTNKEIKFIRLTSQDSDVVNDADILYQIKLYDKKSGQYSNINEVGSGTIHIIDVLIGILSNDINVIIQQPETHLHPGLQSKIIEWLLESIDDQSYFIETHSEHIIKAVQLAVARNKKASTNKGFPGSDEVAIYYSRYDNEQQQTIIKKLELDDFGSFREPWPDDFFELSADLTLERLKSIYKARN